jgi:hypothetical protein
MTQQSMVLSTSAALMGSGADATTLPSKFTLTRRPGEFEASWRWRDQVEKRRILVTPWLRQAQAQELAALIETELRG